MDNRHLFQLFDSSLRCLNKFRRCFIGIETIQSSFHPRSSSIPWIVTCKDSGDRFAVGMFSTYRMQTLPFTAGKIPYSVPWVKLEVIRTLDRGLEEIPYDRTRLPPSRPFSFHTAGFVVSELVDRLRSKSIISCT